MTAGPPSAAVRDGDALARLDVPVPRYTSYPPVPAWTSAFDADAHGLALERVAGAAAPLSLYVHLPFCRRLCSYCGCNVAITREPNRPDAYIDDLAREMDLVLEHLGERRRVVELHWGGGTPTLLDEAQITRLWSEIERRFRLAPDAEIAIEVDPRSTPAEKLAFLRGLGFTRVSIGVQDLDDAVQWAVGRGQTESSSLGTIDEARTLGFASVGVDLICGLPLQLERTWGRTLETIAAHRPDRIAVFSFAYVPEMRPHQRRLDAFPRPRGRDKLALQLLARRILEDAGYRAIGFDHFALPSDELARAKEEGRLQRSFQGYGVRRATDLVGLGASAISDVGGAYAQNVRPLAAYAAALRAGVLPTERGIVLTDDERRRRRAIEAILCAGRIDLAGEEALLPALERLRDLERDGVVRIDGTTIEVTRFGLPFARLAAAAFDPAFGAGTGAGHARAI